MKEFKKSILPYIYLFKNNIDHTYSIWTKKEITKLPPFMPPLDCINKTKTIRKRDVNALEFMYLP